MSEHSHAEYLRPLERVTQPDLRTEAFVRVEDETGVPRPLRLADYHAAAASVTLSESVPEKVRIQFETAKNLYLYAWFVYRFFPVAEHQSLTCLEYALRERYAHEIPEDYVPANRRATLRPLLQYAVDNGDICNEGFYIWHQQAKVRCYGRHITEKIREMDEHGLSEIPVDYDEAEIRDEDRDLEYVNALAEALPDLRNRYAHGSTTLHNTVLLTMRLVAECINQIY